ncbi:uncharacterized protein EV154DRAFT_511732 [Mucor mucedo]|uniref:uncharacterized protein n=1 Tax=Mucor mucedo TaxID=29922 RepID=UPI00221FC000|nr:uncharacterized protein EV154DRAFT_511732 [Mucor mucedo]KAI7890323.1 hypothetical protein EV154DRAFT_511732 [Mucor mucedo]
MSAASLNLEILLCIFSHVDKSTLEQCDKVCKNWKHAASKSTLLQQVELDITNIPEMKTILSLGSTNLLKELSRYSLIKKLTLHNDMYNPDCVIAPLQFAKLLGYLPKLQVLELRTKHYEKYMKVVSSLDPAVYLRHIQDITPPEFFSYARIHPSEHHFQACYRFRATLTILHMVGWMKHTRVTKIDYENTWLLLSHFTALRQLHLRHPLDDTLTIERLLEASPNLNYLFIDVNLAQSGYPVENNVASDDVLAQNKPKNTTLTKLFLMMPSVSRSDITYINDRVSDQLQDIVMFFNTDLNEWIESVGMDNAVKLAKRASHIDNVSITFKKKDFCHGGNRSKTNVSNMTNYFKLFNVFRVQIPTCDANFGNTSALQDRHLFEYALQKCDYYRETEDGEHVIEIALPDISTSIIGPEIFKSLRVEICEPDEALVAKFLQYAMTHCPALEKYDYNNFIYSNESIRIQLRSNQDARAMSSNNISVKRRMTMLVTGSGVPSKSVMDEIASHAPLIEMYSVNHISHTWVSELNHPIDITGFIHLTRFYLDLGRFFSRVCIKFADSGNESYYEFDSDDHRFYEILSIKDEYEESKNIRGQCERQERKFMATIICNQNTTLVFRYGESSIVGEVKEGQLCDYVSSSPQLKSKCYLLEKVVYT